MVLYIFSKQYCRAIGFKSLYLLSLGPPLSFTYYRSSATAHHPTRLARCCLLCYLFLSLSYNLNSCTRNIQLHLMLALITHNLDVGPKPEFTGSFIPTTQ